MIPLLGSLGAYRDPAFALMVRTEPLGVRQLPPVPFHEHCEAMFSPFSALHAETVPDPEDEPNLLAAAREREFA